MARLYNEMDCRDDLSHLLGIHIWCFTVAAMPQLLYNTVECSTELKCHCSEELDILVSSLEQLQAKIPGAMMILNTVNRLRTAHNGIRDQNSTRARVSREKVSFGEAYDISDFRDLFPFPTSLSPRLALLEHDSSNIFQSLGTPPRVPDDFSWIFEEFSDLSSQFAFSDVPQPLL